MVAQARRACHSTPGPGMAKNPPASPAAAGCVRHEATHNRTRWTALVVRGVLMVVSLSGWRGRVRMGRAPGLPKSDRPHSSWGTHATS